MRPLAECRVAHESQTVREALVQTARPGRRTGAIMVLDDAGRLAGLFTDSDLARLLESRELAALDAPITERMVTDPTTITAGARVSEAVRLLADRKFSELPVVDAIGKALGLVDVTDVVASDEDNAPESEEPARAADRRRRRADRRRPDLRRRRLRVEDV